MENLQTLHPVTVETEFTSDPRWQLLERILLTAPFQKSSRLPTLLRYLAEHSICERPDELTEQRIGTAVFGKPAGYSPAEDSSVRVHVRQLRLRLHEYFDCEGRDELLIVEIPKGSYQLVFHSANSRPPLSIPASSLIQEAEQEERKPGFRNVLFWVALATACICGFGWYHAAKATRNVQAPWPLSAVMQNGQPAKVVVSDGTTMLRLLGQKEFSLEEYLQPGFLASMTPPHMDENFSRLVTYISDSQLVSFADVMVSSTLVKLAGPQSDRLVLLPARDLNQHDLKQGNYVFVGGPTSNPWVALFSDKLNFQIVEDGVGGKMYFLNKKPLAGEQPIYEGLKFTGSGGEDYATISLLPNSSGQGNVLILQGLREEGTEALAMFLSDDADRMKLERALDIPDRSKRPVYFEALIRARTVAGAPVSIGVVATRVIAP